MQGGVIGGICLLTFLLSVGRAEELESLKALEEPKEENLRREIKEQVDLKQSTEIKAPDDLKNEISLVVTESNTQEDEERSGAMTSSALSFGGSSLDNAVAQSNDGGYSSAYSDAFGGSAQSKATAVVGGAQASQISPFSPELTPYIPPGSSLSQAEAQAISDSSSSSGQGQNSYPYSSPYPYNSGPRTGQAQAEANNGYYQPTPIVTPILNPFNRGMTSAQAQAQADNGYYQPTPIVTPILSPYNQGLGSTQAQTQADNGYYQPSPMATPNVSPYNRGMTSAQAQAQADNGYYQPSPIATPNVSPYNQGLSSAQAQTQADNGYYQPSPMATPNVSPNNQGLSSTQAQNQADNGSYQPRLNSLPNLSPYNQESSSAQVQAQVDSESYKPILRKPVSRFYAESDSLSAFPQSYPYSQGSSSAQAQAQAANGLYPSIPGPDPKFSPYERFLVPYKRSSSNQPQAMSEAYQPIPMPRLFSQGPNSASGFSSSYPYNGVRFNSAESEAKAESEPYQPIPIPDPNPAPYDPFLVPYRGPESTQAQPNNEAYQPISFSKYYPKPIDPNPKPYSGGSNSVYGPRINSAQAQAESVAYQPIPIPDPNPSPYESFMVPFRAPNSAQAKAEDESDEYQPIPIPYDPKTNTPYSSSYPDNIVRSGGFIPALDDDINSNIKSKSGWNLYEYNPYPTSGPNPQLYTSGAAAAQAYPDVKPVASGVVNPYSQGISPYTYDYPSESPYRPGGYNQAENEAQGQPNVFSSGQSSPIAFEDAKSRLILPIEYVFPNKMPGGENTIQCSKENEFHHFWSQALECLVCICLNEYGLLTPVCASCGGCHSPPPKLPEPFPRLPESIPVQPETPEPFEPFTIIPEPYPLVPQPEPNPPEPLPEPYQPYPPSPEPYPPYPEPIPAPSPSPVPFPEPVPTLPPVPAEATCNPLPSGTPFTNPLHPCQICICKESYVSGKPDVQIECKKNPQCIEPDDVTALPPLPDVPVPIPLPICEKFPEHVLFPHPTDGCKLCKCSKSVSEFGVPEQQLTCYPHPDCVAKPEPITEPEPPLVPPPLPIPIEPYQLSPFLGPEPISPEPLREPFEPMKPVPLPEIVTVEPLPWPPLTTIAPVTTPVPTLALTPRPGPLPGPSPHESCRPYPPNQPFQHPWDECQFCLCTEAFAIGMVTVEVNCYTKPSCCIEPPDSLKPAIAGKLPFFSQQYPVISNAVSGPDIQTLSGGVPSGFIITSTYRPPSIYPSYTPRSVNIYPGSQGSGADAPTQPQGYLPSPYPRPQNDEPFANPPSKYPYQPNYYSEYVKPQYAEYPPRLPLAPSNTIGPYKPNSYGYPGNYQYEQGDAVENAYPGPRGHYQPYVQRYQDVPPPNMYPPMYQRLNYEMSPMYPPGQVRDNYQSVQGGPNVQGSPQGYAGDRVRTKSGNDEPEDTDTSQ